MVWDQGAHVQIDFGVIRIRDEFRGKSLTSRSMVNPIYSSHFETNSLIPFLSNWNKPSWCNAPHTTLYTIPSVHAHLMHCINIYGNPPLWKWHDESVFRFPRAWTYQFLLSIDFHSHVCDAFACEWIGQPRLIGFFCFCCFFFLNEWLTLHFMNFSWGKIYFQTKIDIIWLRFVPSTFY